jgi:hypothetical protein
MADIARKPLGAVNKGSALPRFSSVKEIVKEAPPAEKVVEPENAAPVKVTGSSGLNVCLCV